MVEKNIDELQKIGKIALSNPWFGVGGLERVYLAISDFKEDTTIISSKNFHNKESFTFYFGKHRSYPSIRHLDISIEGDSPWVYNCMCEAIHRFIPRVDAKIHITNHWGLFQNIELPNHNNYIYFQPGVWELERVVQDPILNQLYKQKLREYPILANSKYIRDFLKEHFNCNARVLYPCTDTIYFKEKMNDNIQNIEEKDYDIMIFSRLNPGKEFTLALDLFEKIKDLVPNSKFLIAGLRREKIIIS
jgi:glycosyltransferase involved in cell wall biosynthesis